MIRRQEYSSLENSKKRATDIIHDQTFMGKMDNTIILVAFPLKRQAFDDAPTKSV